MISGTSMPSSGPASVPTSPTITMVITTQPKIRVLPSLARSSSAANQTGQVRQHPLELLAKHEEREVVKGRVADGVRDALEEEDPAKDAGSHGPEPRDRAWQPVVKGGGREHHHPGADAEVDDGLAPAAGDHGNTDRQRDREQEHDGGHEASDRSHVWSHPFWPVPDPEMGGSSADQRLAVAGRSGMRAVPRSMSGRTLVDGSVGGAPPPPTIRTWHERATSTTVERLGHALTDRGPGDPTADELTAWLSGSARFRAFAEAHRDKIHKKFNGADPNGLRDVRAELAVARLLLADKRFDLAFEAYGSGKVGPDFSVAFRDARSFNLEVTRLRRLPAGASDGSSLLAKLRQLPPSVPNVVLLAIDGDTAAALDIDAIVRTLRSRADAKDESFFSKRGLDGSRGFYERFRRLGGVIVWCEAAAGDERAVLWINRSARIALPDRAIRAGVETLRA